MPLKEMVIGLLDEVDDVAGRVRAVNTVVLTGGRRVGHNTDITGLQQLIPSGARTVTVLGAGATARSAVMAIAASGTARVEVRARRPEASAELTDLAASCGLVAEVGAWPIGAAELTADVVISTVPASAASAAWAPAHPGVLIDVIYDPWPTQLASGWKSAGGTVVGGLELLVRQAVEQVELMCGRRPAVEVLQAAGEAALAARGADDASRTPASPDIAQEEQ
jgi:shikimate dehydrogenase